MPRIALKRFRLDTGSLPRAHYGQGAMAVLTGRSGQTALWLAAEAFVHLPPKGDRHLP